MMRTLYTIAFLGLSLSGCNDYPGQSTKEIVKSAERAKDSVKLTLKPSWGDAIGDEVPQGGDCHIDVINDKAGEGTESHRISKSGPLMNVSGWGAISVKQGVLASDIALALKATSSPGARIFAAPVKGKRPDVADYFKSPGSVDTGFKSAIDLSDVMPGEYILEVIQNKDGKNYKCQYTAKIIIEK